MKEGLFLSKRDQFVFRQIAEFNSGKLSRQSTARLIRRSERTVSRLATRIRRDGFLAIAHGNRGRIPHNKLEAKLKDRVMKLVKSRYYDFNMLHCLEILKTRHKIILNRETFRRWCSERQMVKRKKRRRSHPRFLRSRMPAEGYLLQMDGSPHRYNGKDVWTLILAIDDATSEIPYAEFFDSETTAACMKVLRKIILKKGLPRALYVDKAGWAGGGKRIEFTQFHRACDELEIQILYANSPQAKGRVERSFNTFQDRLIPELRLRRIKSMPQANRYLNRVFLKKYWNKRNTVIAADAQTEYRQLKNPHRLEEILCFKQKRAVGYNNCISIRGDIYQLIHPTRQNMARKRVEIRYYEEKPMAVFLEDTPLKCKLVQRYKKQEKTWDEHIAQIEKL